MLLTKIKRYLRPEEVIALPFLILLLVLSYGLGQPIDFRPAFIFWITLIVGLTVIVTLFIYWTKIMLFVLGGKTAPLSGFRWYSLYLLGRYWLPIAVILIVYENLHNIVPLLAGPDRDKYLLAIDLWLFGPVHPTLYLERIISPALTAWLSFCYLTFFFYLPILALVLYKSKRGSRVLILAVTITLFLGFIGYIAVPAVGPLHYLASSYQLDLAGNFLSDFRANVIADLSIVRDVFPSLHVALTAVYLYAAWRYKRWLFYIFLPFIVCLWFSTVYLRYHYVIDIVAGFVLAVAAVWFSEKIYKRWYGEDQEND